MRLLIVSPRAFMHGWGGQTPRLLQMARGLVRSGWTVELLRCKHPLEGQFLSIIDAFPGRVHVAPFFGPFSSLINRKGLRRAMRIWWRLRRYIERDDYPELVASRLSRFCLKTFFSKPDVVFGITDGQLESFASAHSLSVQFGRPLVLEFRDPLPHPGNPPLDPLQRELLERCLAHASLVITTTKSLSRMVAGQFPRSAGKVRTIYSCYDDEVPVAAPAQQPADGLVLVHAGLLYGGKRRNARSLIKAISQAARQDATVHNRIRLRLIGMGQGGVEALELARQLQVPWAVELVPQMPHRECLRELDRAHVLVVIKFDDPEYDQQIPGKLFQYLGREKPLLGIMRQTEAAEILCRSGLGLVFDHSDIDGIAEALLKFLHNVGSLDKIFKPDGDYIRGFALSEMAGNFDRELSALLTNATSTVKVTGAVTELRTLSCATPARSEQ